MKRLVAYRYNALGQRIAWHHDTDADGTLETTSDDPWAYGLYNERWQLLAEIGSATGVSGVSPDDDPAVCFVHHGAGLGGRGGSSYIDDVIMADDDTNDDGVLEERTYSVQNWRHDVVALTEPDGDVIEVTDFTLYGETIDVLVGDLDRDGDVDGTDTTAFNTANPTSDCGSSGCPSDFDRDNDVDGDDAAYITKEYGDEYRDTVGVSLNDRAHGRGYAGYKSDRTMPIYHVRHRAYRPDLGKWTKRDPAGYADGGNVYAYARSNAIKSTDAMGLCAGCNSWGGGTNWLLGTGTYTPAHPAQGFATSITWILQEQSEQPVLLQLTKKCTPGTTTSKTDRYYWKRTCTSDCWLFICNDKKTKCAKQTITWVCVGNSAGGAGWVLRTRPPSTLAACNATGGYCECFDRGANVYACKI